MSRVENLAVVQPLHEAQLFGSIPQLSDDDLRQSKRLSDQIGLLKERGFEEGYQSGYENGVQMGQAEGRRIGEAEAKRIGEMERQKQSLQFLNEFERLKAEFELERQQWFEASERTMAELAMSAVRKILAAELTLTQEHALNITKEVLGHLTHTRQVVIRIHPNDFALFEGHRDELAALAKNLDGIEIIRDDSVQGGVTIETESGVIDATIDTRMHLLENSYDQAS